MLQTIKELKEYETSLETDFHHRIKNISDLKNNEINSIKQDLHNEFTKTSELNTRILLMQGERNSNLESYKSLQSS